jgi:hypothetical protein
MREIPPLPELRFTEIPAASRYRYTGDRFSYMEAGQSKLSPVLLLHGSARTRCTGVINWPALPVGFA